MTGRLLTAATAALLALAVAGCGGGNGSGGSGGDGEASAGGGDCAGAKSELLATVSERDRLFVDLQLDKAAKACASEAGEGTVALCAKARADLADAASQETPPPDLEARVDSAVDACAGTTITSTLPAP